MNRKNPTIWQTKHFIMTVLVLAIFMVIIGFLYKGLDLSKKPIPSTLVGKPAPSFTVAWIQGRDFLATHQNSSFSLSDLKGHPVILNFWASWCVSCREEARELEQFWQQYKGDGIFVVGIAIQDRVEAARQFAKEFGKTYILGLDEDGSASIDYGVTGVPETFLINKKGVIVHKETGPVTVKMLEKHLPKLLQ